MPTESEVLAAWSKAVAAPPTESGPLWADYDRLRREQRLQHADRSQEL